MSSITGKPIVTTGHSLGGGLAGFVSALGQGEFVVFDHMPFLKAAAAQAFSTALDRAIVAATTEFGAEISIPDLIQLLPEGDQGALGSAYFTFVDTFIDNLNLLQPTLLEGQAYHLDGEVNELLRSGDAEVILGATAGSLLAVLSNIPTLAAPLAAYGIIAGAQTADLESQVPNIPVPNFDIGLGIQDLHSQALLTTLMFGQYQWGPEESGGTEWQVSIKHIAPGLLDDDIGTAIGLIQSTEDVTGTGLANPGDQMASMIAYSLINEGANSIAARPFGDSAIRSLFGDADDLGAALENLPAFVDDDILDDIGKLVAEFAGLLAFNKVLRTGEAATSWSESSNGILTFSEDGSGSSLTIDLTDPTWSLNSILPAPHEILSSEGLAESIIEKAVASAISSGDGEFVLAQLEAWVLAGYQSQTASAFDDIDGISLSLSEGTFFKAPNTQQGRRLLMVGTDGDDAVQLDEEDSPAILIGAGGQDVIHGAAGDDAFVGGDDNDELSGGDGNDWFFAGGGNNTVDGGAGHDEAIYSGLGTTNIWLDSANPNGDLRVFGSYQDDSLSNVEHIKVDADTTWFKLKGTLGDVQLTIEAMNEGGTSNSFIREIIDGKQLSHGIGIRLNDGSGTSQIYNTESGGAIDLINFNTEIVGTDFDDEIFDGSNHEKVINGGEGNDSISVEGTTASAVIFGGGGADSITGSNAADFLIAKIDYFGWDNNDQVPTIKGEDGDDVIVINGAFDDTGIEFYEASPFGRPLDDIYSPIIDLTPGKGDDLIKVDINSAWIMYTYEAGDGHDVIELESSSNLRYVSNFLNADPNIEHGNIYQAALSFDFSNYTSEQISAAFSVTDQRIVAENLPNRDFTPYWEVKGDLTFSFSDGGSIVVSGITGLWSADTTSMEREGTAYDVPPSSEIAYGWGYPGLDILIATADDEEIHIAITQPGGVDEEGGDFPVDPPTENSVSTVAPMTVDQDILLAPGQHSFAGGDGHDRLIVTWDMDALTASFANGQLVIEDRWGLIGQTVLSDFDEIHSISDSTSYTPEQFAAELANRQIGAGTSEDDILYGTVRNDHLNGGLGNDTLFGGVGADFLNGGEGNDHLTGGDGGDYLDGGSGYDVAHFDGSSDDFRIYYGLSGSLVVEERWSAFNGFEANIDVLENIEELSFLNAQIMVSAIPIGTVGADAYVGGSGNDVFYGREGDDVLNGGNGDNDLFGNDGNDTLVTGDGNDRLDGGAGDDSMSGGNGDDLYFVDAYGDTIFENVDGGMDTVMTTLANYSLASGVEVLEYAGSTHFIGVGNALDNTLRGGLGDDHLDGADGDDQLEGGAGDDSYIMTLGYNIARDTAGNDSYQIGAGGGYIVDDSGDDAYTFSGESDFLITDYGGADYLIFAATILPADVSVSVDNGDILIEIASTGKTLTLNSALGHDGFIEEFHFDGGTVLNLAQILQTPTSGSDDLYGTSGSDTIFGGAGNDWIDGLGGNDILNGEAGTDYLTGGGGDDIYRFELGGGTDWIQDYSQYSGTSRGFDIVEFGPGILPQDVTVAMAGNGSRLTLSIAGTSDKVILDDTLISSDYHIEAIHFDNGTTWNNADLLALAQTATAGADTLYGSPVADTIWGYAGDDVIIGRDGDDVLVGGLGNDILEGGSGNDIYKFDIGDGQDIISDYTAYYEASYVDAIEFGVGIAPGDIIVTTANYGDDIVLSIDGTSDQITIASAGYSNEYEIEEVRFDNGSVWTSQDLFNMAWQTIASSELQSNMTTMPPEDSLIAPPAQQRSMYFNSGRTLATLPDIDQALMLMRQDIASFVPARGMLDGRDRLRDSPIIEWYA
ncbi:calcium-binding protein [Croceicoccus sp. Ery5]|uniref:calcium-binding protein n=1 Tax=Croceicoccus sp. Ery5 TaxID=1703340 RepID=UPI002714F830|nr:calcium-binding protein [Croceicoccus sp. Ery5]